ncbi:hypothetical protein KI387_003291, partial [Taxus chinensis]
PLLTYHSTSIAYGDMYRAHRHETRLTVLMMMGVLHEMVEEHTCYAWAPVYLVQLYRELW